MNDGENAGLFVKNEKKLEALPEGMTSIRYFKGEDPIANVAKAPYCYAQPNVSPKGCKTQ